MTEKQRVALISDIQAGRATNEAKMALFEGCKLFCYSIANQYRAALRTDDEIQDLEQESFLCVLAAAESFNESSGCGFLTWLKFFLLRAFDNYIGRQAGGSARSAQLARTVRRFESDYLQQTGQNPTDAQICENVNISQNTLNVIRAKDTIGSLDAEISGAENLCVADKVPAPGSFEDDIIDDIVRQQVRATICKYIDYLPQSEGQALRLFYLQGETDAGGAKICNISVKSFRNERIKGLRHLKATRLRAELSRLLPERAEAAAYHNTRINGKWQSSTERAAFLATVLQRGNYNDFNF